MARNADLSALFSALIAQKAAQRKRVTEHTTENYFGGGAGYSSSPAPSSKDIAWAAMRSYGDTAVMRKPVSITHGRQSFADSLKSGAGNILSGGQRILDILERPSAASAGVYASMVGNTKSNPAQAWLEGLTSKKYGHFADVAKEADKRAGKFRAGKEVGYGVGGFIADVVTDPTTYLGVGAIGHAAEGVGRGLKALGIAAPRVVKNTAKLEVASAAERAAADLSHTGSTSVGPNGAAELQKLLSQEAKKQYQAQVKPLADLTQFPAPTKTRFTVDTSGAASDVTGTATKGKSAAQLEAMLKLGNIQKYLGEIQPYKYSRNGAVRRIAEGDQTLPLPFHSAPDPIEQARYNRRMGALRTNKMRREQAQANYQTAVENAGKKRLPAIPREDAHDIAKRAAIAGKSVLPTNQIVKAKLAAGETPRGVADFLEAQAKQEGRDLTIPFFIKGENGRYRPAMEVNVPAFENLLHTGKISKPVPLTAKGELKTVKEAISDTGIVETKVKGRLTYGYQKGGKAKFEATAQHSAFLADSENLAEDLQRLHLIDPDSGHVVPLGKFLEKHNITPSTLQSGAAEKITSALTGEGPSRANPLYGLLPKEPKFKGELATPEAPSLVHTPYSREEVQQWISEHASDLTPQQISYILNGKGKNVVRGPEGMIKRARQIANQFGKAGSFNRLDDVLSAVEKGDVHPAQLQRIMDELGVSKVEEIRPALAAVTGRMTAKEEILAKATNEIDAAQEAIDTAITQTRPVDELLDTINHSDEIAQADAKLTEGLDGFEKAKVDDIVRDVIQYQHYRPQNKEVFPHVTKKGVPRTSKVYGEGEGVHKNTFNEGAQLRAASASLSVVGDNWKKLATAAKKVGEAAPDRPQYMYDHALPLLKAVEARMRANNLPVVLGSKASGIPLGLSDILDVLPPEFVKKYVFTYTKALDPTQIMRIGEILVNFGSKKVDAETAAQAVLEHLVSPRHSTGLAAKAKQGQISWSNFSKFVNSQEGRDEVAREVASVFLKATPRIVDAANMRAVELNLKLGQHAQAVSDAVIQKATAVLADPWASTSQKTIAIADAEGAVKPASKAALKQQGIERAPDGGDAVAQNIVRQSIDTLDGAQVAKAVAQNAAKMNRVYSAEKVMRGGRASNVVFNHNIKEVGKDAMREAHDVVEQIAKEEGQHLVYDLGAKIDMAFQYRMARYMFGHIGNDTLRGVLLNRVNLVSTQSKHIGVQLGRIAQSFSKDDIHEAFVALQEGRTLDNDAFRSLNKVFGDIFGPTPDDAGNYVNLFTTLGVTAEDINFHGKKFGLLDSVMFPGGSTPEAMANSFKAWDLGDRDVLETLNRLHAATQNAGVMRTLGSDFSVQWGKKVKPLGEEGWVKLKDSGSKSLIYKMIDTELYYPEYIAREMHVLDETLKTLHDPLAQSKVARFYDGTLHAFKAGLTIYRPGHHFRNAIGDAFFNYLDGVKPYHHTRALSVLHVGRSQYKEWDSVRALQATGLTPDNARIVVRNKRAGVELSADQAHKLMYQSGNLPDYKILEDIGFGEEGATNMDIASKLRQLSPLKGKAHDVASTVSEVRDHYFRAAHWLHAFEQVKPMKGLNKEAQLKYMADEATKRVRKWHPDGSDLTMFEKKRMRRIIPFYSWMRKAIPLVMEATFTRPGRVLMYPKAMYNLAEGMGIDLESYANPFPEDQLFPSWMADATQGPAFEDMNGKYYGIQPGIPTADIMDQYMSSPKGASQTFLGSLTPALKVPLEMMQGRDVRTDLPIRDKTDWVDRQIPGVSNIATLTGRSPSSGMTQLTQSAQTAKEYNPEGSSFNVNALINLLSGAGLQDMSKPNYIKSAELEQKYKARELYRKMQGG